MKEEKERQRRKEIKKVRYPGLCEVEGRRRRRQKLQKWHAWMCADGIART